MMTYHCWHCRKVWLVADFLISHCYCCTGSLVAFARTIYVYQFFIFLKLLPLLSARDAIVTMFIHRLSVRLSVHLSVCQFICLGWVCIVSIRANLSLQLYSLMFWAPWHQSISTYSQPSFSSFTWKRGGVWTCKLGVASNANNDK